MIGYISISKYGWIKIPEMMSGKEKGSYIILCVIIPQS